MKKLCSLVLAFAMILGLFPASALAEETTEPQDETVETYTETSPWDLFKADAVSYTDHFQELKNTGTVEQRSGYVNISKLDSASTYIWLAPKDSLVLPKTEPFTVEATLRAAGEVAGDRTNQFSARVKDTGKYFPIFLKYGTDGGLTNGGNWDNLVPLDTTVWHNYAMVIDPTDNSYTIFVDGEKVLGPIISGWGYDKNSNTDLVRVGVDKGYGSNLDVLSLRVGTGDLSEHLTAFDEADNPDQSGSLQSVTLSNDTHVEGNDTDVAVTVSTANIANGETIGIRLVDKNLQPVNSAEISAQVMDSEAEATLTIPASVSCGDYYVQASWNERTLHSEKYVVSTSRTAPEFPTFVSTGYTIDMAEYKYNPTQEFNFPTIVDTKEHPVTNSMGNYRYYLFYAPHNNPAGNCVAASNSLDGPWVEYEGNPVVGNAWSPHYSVSHVSSPHVMWNDGLRKYIMYFHGENPTTRYATSDDLLTWTYGGVCVTANEFSTTGGFSEASYARVYEHKVPGLGNNYIMTMMITGSGNGMQRNIYWAHSVDGIKWTPMKTPLLTPSDPMFKNNFSGANFMEWEGRYFVICHSSNGDMHIFEVGESLNESIYWGDLYASQGSKDIPGDDDNHQNYPDYARAGAPSFIQDDDGRWHMFYEGGRRLHANIVHAVEVRAGEEDALARAFLGADDKPLTVGDTLETELIIFDRSDVKVPADRSGLTITYESKDTAVATVADGIITAVGKGETLIWATVEMGGVTVLSAKVRVTVAEKTEHAKEVIITNADTPNKTALNLELPAVFKAQGVLQTPIDNYYLYFSYTDEAGGAKSIALATAPAPEGPWTLYQDGTPIMTKSSLGLSDGVNAPWPVWDAENNRMLMYYSSGVGMIGVAESKDGITFQNIQTVLKAADLPFTGNTYQQSVYEYTIPGKDNKYVMLYTGNGYTAEGVKNGKQLFMATSKDGMRWEAAAQPLLSPGTGDNKNIASPRLLMLEGEPYVVYHNSTGDLEYAQLSADFSTDIRKGTLYDSVEGEPDRNRAADAAFLKAEGTIYLYYTARSNKAKNEADASVLVCRKLELGSNSLFQDDFSGGNAAGWTVDSGTWAVVDGAYVQSSTSGSGMSFAGDMTWTDYEVEVKVTPVATGKNIAVMVSGRADGAANRYIGSYNGGELSINRRINTKDQKLATKTYTMDLGKTYTMRMVFQGDKIALYINGTKELEATDSTHAKGEIGLATFNTSAKFDDVVVRAVSGEPAPSAPVTVTDFGDHQVIQRDPATKNASVTVGGTAAVAAAKIEARIVKFEGGAAVRDWTTVATDVAAGAAWSGSVTVPQGGWYQLEVRALDTNGQEIGTAQGTNKWGVGINILCIGQSNMVGQGKDKPYTVANDLVANYRSGTWKHLADPYDGAGGSLVPAMGNALVEELGIPVGFVPAADSGSGLHAPNPFTTPPHGPTRYWMYNDPADPNTLYNKALGRAKAAGGVELAVWNQGETDGSILVPKEVYESDMKELLSWFRRDLGNAELPMFLCQIGTHNPNISNDAAYTAIRSAQHDLDDGKNFFLAATEMEFARQDTAHYKTAGMNEIGKRVANSVLYYYGESSYYRGPYISGAAYADDTRTVIDVKITHRGGKDITPASGNIPGFSVLDGTKEVKVASAVRLNAATVRLTLEHAVAGSGQVRYLYGLNPFTDEKTTSTESDLKTDGIVVKDNTPLALPLENTTTAILVDGDAPPVVEQWNLMDHAMGPDWKADGWRANSKTGTFNQMADYLNIKKPNESNLGSRDLYHYAISPATLALPRGGFTLQVRARVAGEVDSQTNEIGIRMGLKSDDTNGKLASVFLRHGENGFVSTSPAGTGRYTMALDTTVWHDYSLVVRQENGEYVFDLYVDAVLAFENAPLVTYKGGDLIRLGADNGGRCDLDVQTVRLGSGEILPEGVSPARITEVTLSADSQKETEAKTVTVTVTGRHFEDGAQVDLALVDRNENVVSGVTGKAVFAGNTATGALAIPAGLSVTGYHVRAQANGRVRYSAAYTVEADRPAPSFPQFTPDGFTIEMEDYKYNPTKEFNFPTIVDTKDHPVTNALGDYRYYLFYAPHDAPAGNCVAASNSLNGPWVEYGSNPVVGKNWEPNYSVSHVSSPFVMWNEVYDCYFMYFHGANNITRYATSTDLINWTYGGVCVEANDFSPTGSGFNEASYAKVFEHEVPGLGNKYIMLLMITGSGTGGHRNIYWAHSVDGKTWTAVQTPLLDPTMDSEYKGNFSGPWFMERDGRYFVICHASSGNMYSFEVGESLNECIPWGMFYDSIDSPDPANEDHDDAWPDYGRAGAPSFMKDDDGIWHMFYEGGKRLHANIVHATAPADPVPPVYVPDSSVTTKTETLPDGTKVTTKTNKRTGTVTVTTVRKDGTKTVVETKKDGSITENLTRPDGVKAAATVTAQGASSASVTVPKALGRTTVEVPAGDGNVVLLVRPDGSTQVITLAVVANGRARVSLDASAQLRFERRDVSFADTANTDYAEAASALAAQGIFQGTGKDAFSPDQKVDRAMLVTLLHRIDGETMPDTEAVFADVPAGMWYAEAAVWAKSEGITNGVGGGNFAPNAPLSWEQLAVMLYRYAKVDSVGDTDMTEAQRALDWCEQNGVGLGLRSNETASRGELASALYNYIKALVN